MLFTCKKECWYEKLNKWYTFGADYKYRTTKEMKVNLFPSFQNGPAIEHPYIRTENGVLLVLAGYCWDGPSGPTWDDRTNMRASLFHDALYQVMRLGLLDYKVFRKPADDLYYFCCVMDGMSRLRVDLNYWALRKFGEKNARPKKEGK